MTHYVYTTARGLCRTVHAQTPSLAWLMACSRHKVNGMHDLSGRSWVAKAGGGECAPAARNMDRSDACRLYFQACLAELPIVREEMPRLVRGEGIAPGLHHLLADRGLAEVDAFRPTDLGRAFAEWIAGGAR